jgi:hypothetical protein
VAAPCPPWDAHPPRCQGGAPAASACTRERSDFMTFAHPFCFIWKILHRTWSRVMPVLPSSNMPPARLPEPPPPPAPAERGPAWTCSHKSFGF